MIERAERLEAYARQRRAEGLVQGPKGAEGAEAAARHWREAVERAEALERRARDLARANGEIWDNLPRQSRQFYVARAVAAL
jgi:DNA topoisomerase IB